MQGKFSSIAVTCAALVATACHSRTVHIATTCTSGASVVCSATAKDDPLTLGDKDKDSHGNVKVKWTSSSTWLVHFKADTPCTGAVHVLEHGRVEECIINIDQAFKDPTHMYKYSASVEAVSSDPAIVHDTGGPLHPPKARVTNAQSALFCLDMSTGSPQSCNNGQRPNGSDSPNPLQVSAGDDIYWKLNSSSTITMDTGTCELSDSITSASPYCTVKTAGSCSGTGSFCSYTVSSNGSTTGPFRIQVK